MSCHALRVLPTYPYGGGKYTGDIIPMGSCATRDTCEDVRQAMANGVHFETVELDDNGQVIEP